MILRRKYKGLDLSEKTYSEINREEIEKFKLDVAKRLIDFSKKCSKIQEDIEKEVFKIKVFDEDIWNKLIDKAKSIKITVEISPNIKGNVFLPKENKIRIVESDRYNIIPLAHEIGHALNTQADPSDIKKQITDLYNSDKFKQILNRKIKSSIRNIRTGMIEHSPELDKETRNKTNDYYLNTITDYSTVEFLEELLATIKAINLLKSFNISKANLDLAIKRYDLALRHYSFAALRDVSAIVSNSVNPKSKEIWKK